MSCAVKGDLKIKCKKCGKTSEHDCDSIDMQAVESHERPGMGVETHYAGTAEIECECGQQIEIEVNCWEYPPGAYNHHDCEVRLGDAEILACCECEVSLD